MQTQHTVRSTMLLKSDSVMHVTVKEVERKERKEEPSLTEYKRTVINYESEKETSLLALFIKECFYCLKYNFTFI